MTFNLACIGLAVSDATELDQLATAAHRAAREIGVFDGVHVGRWQDDSGAALILGWRSGELLDLMPVYTATSGGLLSDCHLINDSVASAAAVDAAGKRLIAMAFAAEQYRQLQVLGRPVSDPALITALGIAVQVHHDVDAFATSPDSLLDPFSDPAQEPLHAQSGIGDKALILKRQLPWPVVFIVLIAATYMRRKAWSVTATSHGMTQDSLLSHQRRGDRMGKCERTDKAMNSGLMRQFITVIVVVIMTAVGAGLATALAGGRWAIVGGVVGGVTTAFAGTLVDSARRRHEEEKFQKQTIERAISKPDHAGGVAWLLDPRYAEVNFVGRVKELDDLEKWCAEGEIDRLRLVTGPGGVGKTRLSIELMNRLRKRHWICHRVADGSEALAIRNLGRLKRKSTLLVIDYAETRTGLRDLLRDLADPDARPVRVLLLARSAGGWWDQLGDVDAAVRDMTTKAKSAQLELAATVDTTLFDDEIVAQAVRAFAGKPGVPDRLVKVELVGGGVGRRRILDLHAAALIALLDSGERVIVQVEVPSVLENLLSHEKRYWYGTANVGGLLSGVSAYTPEEIGQLVAVGALLGAATQSEAQALPARIPGREPSPRMAAWLRDLYWPESNDSNWIGSLQPDRLAELHVVRELSKSRALATASLTGLNAHQALRAVPLLARAAADDSQAEDLLAQTLPDVAWFIADLDAPRETLIAIYNAIPYPTVILAQAAVGLSQRIIGLLPEDSEPAVRGMWLFYQGFRLRYVGRAAEALPATEEAIGIFRELAAVQPDRWRRDLAAMLMTLSLVLSDVGQTARAVPVCEEAVGICRDLVVAHPDQYRVDLAGSLTTLGNHYSDIGRTEQALSVTSETVGIYRELAEEYPDRYRGHLAESLMNLSNRYRKLGRTEQALQMETDAVSTFRELAAEYPDKYQPNLATSLSNLSTSYSDVGRADQALSAIEEAVGIFRDLTAAQPDQYRPGLGTSLSNLSTSYSDVGRADQALSAIEEAVGIFRDLTAAQPDRYRLELATSLMNLGVFLRDVGRADQALSVIEEAVGIFRELAAEYPDRYRPDLATALTNLSTHFSELGRTAKALSVIGQVVGIFRELAAEYPDRYRSDLATALTNLGWCWAMEDRPILALPVAEEAVAIFRELATEYPDRYRPDFAYSLKNLGIVLSELGSFGRAFLGSFGKALLIADEAISIYRELAAVQPDRFRPELARSLLLMADILELLGRYEYAASTRAEAAVLTE